MEGTWSVHQATRRFSEQYACSLAFEASAMGSFRRGAASFWASCERGGNQASGLSTVPSIELCGAEPFLGKPKVKGRINGSVSRFIT
jgi:hypothetical protein